MKKTVFAFLAGGLIFTGLLSFRTLYDARNNTAEVEQIEGLYVFTDSRPVKEYDFLGTVKGTLTMGSGQYTDLRNKMIKKVRKEYPEATGILIHFTDGGTDKADAIKFK